MDTVRTLKKQLKSKGAEDIVILPSEKGVHFRCNYPTDYGAIRGGGFIEYS